MAQLMSLARTGRFDPTRVLTHSFRLARMIEAHERSGSRKDGVLKVAIRP
jgi:threonine dehydrogenase-like Zn-dependent dehydrogenase